MTRLATCWIRAPKDQLDKVDRTVQSLNEPKQKVEIDTQFATVSQTDTKGLNFGLDLGNFAVGKGAVGLVGGTASSYQGSPTVNNPSGVFPGPGPVALSAGKIAPSASDAEPDGRCAVIRPQRHFRQHWRPRVGCREQGG